MVEKIAVLIYDCVNSELRCEGLTSSNQLLDTIMMKPEFKTYSKIRPLEQRAKKRLVASVSSVQPTAAIETKAKELASVAKRASEAVFLDKYRRAHAA